MLIFFKLLVCCVTYMGTIWLSTKAADYHYKIKDTEAPLYYIYGGLFVSLWCGSMIILFNYLQFYYE